MLCVVSCSTGILVLESAVIWCVCGQYFLCLLIFVTVYCFLPGLFFFAWCLWRCFFAVYKSESYFLVFWYFLLIPFLFFMMSERRDQWVNLCYGLKLFVSLQLYLLGYEHWTLSFWTFAWVTRKYIERFQTSTANDFLLFVWPCLPSVIYSLQVVSLFLLDLSRRSEGVLCICFVIYIPSMWILLYYRLSLQTSPEQALSTKWR